MSVVLVLELIQLILFLGLFHLIFHMWIPRFDVPFFGITASGLALELMMTIFPAWPAFWIVLNLFSAAGIVFFFSYLRRTQPEIESAEPADNSRFTYTAFSWVAAVSVAAVLFVSLVYLHPANTQMSPQRVSRSSALLSELFVAEDNFSHVNIIAEVRRTGKTTYFENKSTRDNHMVSPLSAYAQFPHVIANNIVTADHVAHVAIGKKSQNANQILDSFMFAHFIGFGMATALGLCVVLKLFYRKSVPRWDVSILIGICGMALIFRYTTLNIIDLGFFSQAAGIASLIMCLFMEATLLDEKKKFNIYKKTTLRLIPVIAIGHTWWFLLPIGVMFFAVATIRDFYPLLRIKQWKQIIITSCIAFLGMLIALIPAYSQIFVLKVSTKSAVNMGGGIRAISVHQVILECAVMLAFSCVLFYLKRNDENRKLYFDSLLFFAIAFSFLVLLCEYQIRTNGAINYYGFKLAWTVFWLPVLGVLLFGAILVRFVMRLISRHAPRSRNVISTLLMLILVLVLAMSMGSFVERRSLVSVWSPNVQQLDDFMRAVDAADQKGVPLIVLSDCSPLTTYFFQRAASSFNTHFDSDVTSYRLGILNGDDVDKLSRRLFSKNKDSYYFFDATPTEDSNAPSDRIDMRNSEGMRTQLDKSSSYDRTGACSTEVISRNN